MYVFGCRLSLFRLCDSGFRITAVDYITNGITWAVFCFHVAHISFASSWYLFCLPVIVLARLCVFGTAMSINYYYYYYYYYCCWDILFWDITGRWLIVLCRLFGTACMSFEYGKYFSRNADKQLPTYTAYISEKRRPQLHFCGSLRLSQNFILLSLLLHTLTSLLIYYVQLILMFTGPCIIIIF
jgi:hypothetical protein